MSRIRSLSSQATLHLVAAGALCCARPALARAQGSAAIPTAATSTAPTVTLDAAAKSRVIEQMAQAVVTTYVDADTGRRIAAHLRQRHRDGAFDTIPDGTRLAQAITRELQVVNGDAHLYAQFQPAGLSELPRFGPTGLFERAGATPGGGRMPMDDPNSEFAARARRANFGLSRVEILPGNIGYLDVTQFFGAPGAEHAIAHALGLLEHTDAIIVDVRRNGGGSGVMSHMLFSHFLEATPVPTIRVRDRLQGVDRVQRSMDSVPGPRRPTVPLYVLTSRNTGSAAEEFAFVLRNRQRATVVGDRTAGAGHMNMVGQVGDGLAVSVSFARVSDPVTGAEWERTGVLPHLAVAQEKALDTAHAHALRRLAETAPTAARAERLRTLAKEAEARAEAPRGR